VGNPLLDRPAGSPESSLDRVQTAIRIEATRFPEAATHRYAGALLGRVRL
jgi:hypothetical protein